MTFRTAAAVAAGKLTRAGLQTLGRGATALPGLITLALDPGAIGAMTASLEHGAVVVSGTNGKTTTSRMLADVVRAAGWMPIHNRSGSNLDRGIAAALLAGSDWTGRPEGDVAIFEVDEASVPRVLPRIDARVVLVTNLFRDQLDRYFEVDQLARRIACGTRPPTAASSTPKKTVRPGWRSPSRATIGSSAFRTSVVVSGSAANAAAIRRAS